jgi:hypothetical protein
VEAEHNLRDTLPAPPNIAVAAADLSFHVWEA